MADTLLGAAHPDNPYFGTAARLSYLPVFDTGITAVNSNSHSARIAAAVKGTYQGFDFDTGIIWSEATQTDTTLQRPQLACQERAAEPDRHAYYPGPQGIHGYERRDCVRNSARPTRRCLPARCGGSARTPVSTRRQCTTRCRPN